MIIGMLVNIDVDDLDRATAFYRDAFGLRVGRRFGDAVVELLGAPSPIYLLAKPAGTAASAGTGQGRDYGRHWTPVHLDMIVSDLDTAVARAEAAGARIESPAAANDWGRIAMLSDPFGHGLCLIQFTGRGYDEIAD